MSLCTTCCDLFTRVDEDSDAFSCEEEPPFPPDQIPTTRHPRLIHPSWDSLCDSVDQRCPICRAVWYELRSSPMVSCRGETHQPFFTWLDHVQGLVHITVLLPTNEKKRVGLQVFRTTKECFEAEAQFLEGDLFSEATFTTVKNWLDQCPKAHPICKSREKLNPNPRNLPTRLLYTHGSKAKTWSLIETRHKNLVPSDYVALSHRWSPDPKGTPKLGKSNRPQYLTPQPDDLLPRTYQDVFALCRALDIRYIWIDSLCIIQDSAEDFKSEVATMMDVYTNAICTFSICWEYPNAGLSFYREPNTFLRWSETYTRHKATTGPKTHAFVRNFWDWEKGVTDAPVNTRGWVFQERLLSSKILYLGNAVLFWECDELSTSETVPGWTISRTNIAAKRRDLAGKWPSLVREFMFNDLSHETDRLFAISGIAQLFAQRTRERFLAGLRETSWAHDLLWHPNLFFPSHNRPAIGDFPSWSWAACPGPLDWPESDEMSMFRSMIESASSNPFTGEKILEPTSDDEMLEPASDDYDGYEVNTLAHLSARSYEAFGSDIYGKPGSTSLDISCFLIPAQYEEFDDETAASNAHDEWLQNPHNPQYARVISNGFLFSTSHHRRGPSLITLPIRERNSECTDFSPSCFVLPLLEESGTNIFERPEDRVDRRGDYEFFDLHALIVQERPRHSADIEKTEEIGDQEYVRIGMFTLTLKGYYKDCPVWLNEFKAYTGIMNGILDQKPRGFRHLEGRIGDLSRIARGKMSLHQADVTVQANWGTIRLV